MDGDFHPSYENSADDIHHIDQLKEEKSHEKMTNSADIDAVF